MYASEILHGVLSHKKNMIMVKKKLGDPPCSRGVDFLGVFPRKNRIAWNGEKIDR